MNIFLNMEEMFGTCYLILIFSVSVMLFAGFWGIISTRTLILGLFCSFFLLVLVQSLIVSRIWPSVNELLIGFFDSHNVSPG